MLKRRSGSSIVIVFAPAMDDALRQVSAAADQMIRPVPRSAEPGASAKVTARETGQRTVLWSEITKHGRLRRVCPQLEGHSHRVLRRRPLGSVDPSICGGHICYLNAADPDPIIDIFIVGREFESGYPGSATTRRH